MVAVVLVGVSSRGVWWNLFNERLQRFGGIAVFPYHADGLWFCHGLGYGTRVRFGDIPQFPGGEG